MDIRIVKDKYEGCKLAFSIIEDTYNKGNLHTLGLATGSSPLELYKELCASNLDFTDKVSINLDEYVGLTLDNEQSYHYYMVENLFNMKPFKHSYLPNGVALDLEEECLRYDQIIEDNPIDIQILGIGNNGHIAFNEPGSSFDLKTHIVDLSISTIDANKRFFHFKEEVPKHALSMGIKSILSAKKIILLAWGSEKADALYKTIKCDMSKEVPASSLQSHNDVIIICDEEAASKLRD